MSTYRAPSELAEQIKFGDEEAKASARKQVIHWLQSLSLKVGDKVYLPDSMTGEMTSFTKGST